MITTSQASVDAQELRTRVQDMYRRVADEPHEDYHFEMGRTLAERLGYPTEALDQIPAASIESFAGVGYYFDLAQAIPGERVLDLGSGSGMDSFLASFFVGPTGRVIGVDMTDAQLAKAESLRREQGFSNVEFRRGYLEELPVPDQSMDLVISNGVINLCPDKSRVFGEIARVLRPGGRVALADIVTTHPLPASVTCNATLWAACIGGAAQEDVYLGVIAAAGLVPTDVRNNLEYRFLSRSAQKASDDYGVRSVSLVARKST